MQIDFENKFDRMRSQFQVEIKREKEGQEEREQYWLRREKELAMVMKKEMDSRINSLAPDSIYRKTVSKSSIGDSSSEIHPKTTDANPKYIKNTLEGHLTPNMSTYDGRTDWRAYYTQFEHIAEVCKWSPKQRLDNLIVCLRDKALKFYSSRTNHAKLSFAELSQKMNEVWPHYPETTTGGETRLQ